MRSGLAPGAFVLALLLGLQGAAQEAVPQIVDVRVGRHSAFDRVVLELEREAPVFRVPTVPGEETQLEIRAQPLLPRQEIATGSPRLELLILEGTLEGTRIRLQRGEGRIRVFLLESPPRLVIDVADPGAEPFEPPPGTQPVPGLSEELAQPPIETPAPVDVAPDEPPPGEPLLDEAPPLEPSPEEPVAGEIAPEAVAPTERPPEEPGPAEVTAEEPLAAGVTPEEAAPEPTPKAPPRAVPPEPKTLPLPPPEAAPRKPVPRRVDRDQWLTLLVWIGAPLLLVGLALSLIRGRRRLPPEATEPRIPESITPGEVLSASDRLDLLEKRIDEEVRARMHLENRVVEVQENLKVVRDRVSRLSLRGEAAL
jgi:hypothetical protein